MNEILIHVTDPTDQRRLIYHRDPEIEPMLLFLRNSAKHRTIYNININGGAVIIGADDNKKLINLEIGIPQASWDLSLKIDWPTKSISGDIEFSQLHTRHSEFMIQTKVFSNKNFELVFLHIGTQPGEIIWVSLSEQCMAGILGDTLVGFLIKRF
jgi:hypothetical protein